MPRARLGPCAIIGFLVVMTELSLALYSEVSFRGLGAQQSTFVPSSPFPERVVFHLPAALLALASVVGGVALYRATRGPSRWSWYAAALAPVAALLAIYKPSVTHALMPLYVKDAVLPWAAPWYWTQVGDAALSLGLQQALYLAAAAYVVAIVLAIPIDNHEGRV